MSAEKVAELTQRYNDEIYQLGLRLLELQERIAKAREILEDARFLDNDQHLAAIGKALDELEGK